jgi:hypothetical protein
MVRQGSTFWPSCNHANRAMAWVGSFVHDTALPCPALPCPGLTAAGVVGNGQGGRRGHEEGGGVGRILVAIRTQAEALSLLLLR